LAPLSTLSAAELVRKCADAQDVEVWEELVRRFHPVIAAAVLRTARRWCEPPHQLLDDLIQDTYLKLCEDHCRLLRSFQPEHSNSIYGFLQVVAANVVHDHFKAERAGKRGGQQTESISELVQSDLGPRATATGSSDAMERQLQLRQIEEVLAREASGPDRKRNRMIFYLYYRQGLTASEIAALPSLRLTTKGVESIISRMTHMIRSHVAHEGFGRVKSL